MHGWHNRTEFTLFGGVGGGVIQKNWGIFNLKMGDQILMKFDIWKEFMSQSSYYKSQSDLVRLGELVGETANLGRCLEWKDRDETSWVE